MSFFENFNISKNFKDFLINQGLMKRTKELYLTDGNEFKKIVEFDKNKTFYFYTLFDSPIVSTKQISFQDIEKLNFLPIEEFNPINGYLGFTTKKELDKYEQQDEKIISKNGLLNHLYNTFNETSYLYASKIKDDIIFLIPNKILKDFKFMEDNENYIKQNN